VDYTLSAHLFNTASPVQKVIAQSIFSFTRTRATGIIAPMGKSSQRGVMDAVEISAIAVCVLFGAHLLRMALAIPAGPFGIVPRTRPGLVGIVFSPLLHANWNHLLANALPLFIFLILLLADRHYKPWRTLAIIWVASGFGTWLVGRGHTVHIGASSVIFGLAAYLIVAALWMKSWRAAFVAAAVLILFGGMFYGVLPQNGPISWEGHLCGAIAGTLAARAQHA
jgi:membrane associated rhomboid family serine protease